MKKTKRDPFLMKHCVEKHADRQKDIHPYIQAERHRDMKDMTDRVLGLN